MYEPPVFADDCSCFSVFTFLTVIVVCLFHGSSLLQGTHTLSPHHRQSARSHTGEFNLVVGIVCYKNFLSIDVVLYFL